MDATRPLPNLGVLLFDFARGRQALLSVAQPALGAVLAAGGLPEGRVLALGLVAATAGFLSVFAANDLYDRHADRQEAASARSAAAEDRFDVDVVAVRHPLAAGLLPLPLGIAWVTIWGAIGLTAAYVLNPICAAIFVACNALEYAYCRLRYRSWLKTIPAGVMVGLGGLAGWVAVAGVDDGAIALFLLLALWEIAGRNLSNDLADVDTDRLVGIATLATRRGAHTTMRWIFAGALTMPVVAAAQAGDLVLRLSLAAVAVAFMTVPAWRLLSSGAQDQALPYFNRASLFPVAALVTALVASWVP